MSGLRLLVRADASASIGMGHAMRCFALAEAFAEVAGGRTTFLMAAPPAAFTGRAAAIGAEVRPLTALPGSPEDAEETLEVADVLGAAWVVLDGYHFDAAFQEALIGTGRRVLAIDDHGHTGSYHADLVLDQNAGADPSRYADRDPRTRLLLGPRFALLRSEFRKFSARRGPVPSRARRVVLTLGGADPDNVSARALEGLATVPGPLEVLLLIGAANRHRNALRAAASASAHHVQVAIDVQDMPARLAWGDLAVAAGGSTTWELARVGTPQLTIVLASNQAPSSAALAREGRLVSLGWHGDVRAESIGKAVSELADDRDRRAELSRRGPQLVDGRGALRVLAAMDLLAQPKPHTRSVSC